MTPEQRVEALFEGWPGPDRNEILDCLRAALRERDAAWRKAVMAHAEKGGEELWCLLTPACDKRLFDCDCEGGAPLRALLEEAGE